jgi:hypothetical protein
MKDTTNAPWYCSRKGDDETFFDELDDEDFEVEPGTTFATTAASFEGKILRFGCGFGLGFCN